MSKRKTRAQIDKYIFSPNTGTQVDSQLISLLPGDSHTFAVTGSLDTLTRIEAEIESLLWSHNRLVNPQ